MAKEEIVTVDEEKIVDDEATSETTTSAAVGAGKGMGILGAGEPIGDTAAAEQAPPSTPYPETAGRNYEPDAEREAMYLRQRALELATCGGIHEAKEPILSVLARAEAYRAYMETGATGIVA